jgi:AcrR family transcriptional regulator
MTETLSTGTPRPVDGRHRRRVENLEAVVEATLELISENGALPTVAEVAERAGISQRSVFRYFDDVDQLTRAAVDARFRQGAALVGMPSPIPVALDDRLRELAASRSRLFEFLGPTARVVRTRLVDNPVLIESVERSRHALRSQLREVLAPELEAAGGEVTLAALDVVYSFEAWDLLRRDQGLSPEEAAAVLVAAASALLVPR